MKIAVLSDIHGNYIALQKCLEHAEAQNINVFSSEATRKIIGLIGEKISIVIGKMAIIV